jgi:hypothetical protein
MFKSDDEAGVDAGVEVSGWELASSQKAGLSRGTLFITYNSGAPRLDIRPCLKNPDNKTLAPAATAEPLSGPCALTISVPVQEDPGHLRFTIDGAVAGDTFRLKLAMTDKDGRRFEHAVIFEVTAKDVVDSAGDLAAVGSGLAGQYILTRDLALSNWAPIGSGSAFTGSFEGRGHTLNLKSFDPSRLGDQNVGVFGQTDGAEIKNLKITADSAHITLSGTGLQYFGLAAGYAQNGTLENINVSGGDLVIEEAGTAALDGGGIAGRIENSQAISNCTTAVNLEMRGTSAPVTAGGIVGRVNSNNCTVENSHSDGNVLGVSGNTTAFEVFIGGVAGYNSGIISRCSATGNIYGEKTVTSSYGSHVGGVVGSNRLEGRISESYASGPVTAKAFQNPFAGGITGYQGSARVNNCYSTGNISAQTVSGSSGESIAGGIVGLNNSYSIERSYAAGRVSAVHFGTSYARAGGVAGRDSSTISNNAALALSLNAESGGTATAYAHRILTNSTGALTNNYAYDSMAGVIDATASNQDGLDGLDKSGSELKSQSTYEALGWNFTPGTGQWKMMAGYPYPVLQWQTSPPAIDPANVIP